MQKLLDVSFTDGGQHRQAQEQTSVHIRLSCAHLKVQAAKATMDKRQLWDPVKLSNCSWHRHEVAAGSLPCAALIQVMERITAAL